jgi:transposase
MLQLTPQRRIFVAIQPVDFRKGIDGLSAVCRQRLGENPLEGAVYVFRNRAGTALKLVLYDGQGYWMMMKRLSQGRFAWWPTSVDARGPLSARALLIVLWKGNPERAQMARDWRRVAEGEARLLAYAPGSHAAGSANTSRRCSGNATR